MADGEKSSASVKRAVVARFRATLDLIEVGISIERQNLRRAHPDATGDEIDMLLAEWLRERPGAEFGDSAGTPVDVRTRFP